MTGEAKQSFLVVYDYGMGGLWGIMLARSAEEIRSSYPELTIVSERPKWMAADQYAQLEREELHDIDGQPWGILTAVLADRSRP